EVRQFVHGPQRSVRIVVVRVKLGGFLRRGEGGFRPAVLPGGPVDLGRRKPPSLTRTTTIRTDLCGPCTNCRTSSSPTPRPCRLDTSATATRSRESGNFLSSRYSTRSDLHDCKHHYSLQIH
ncbi:hypothetical protein EGW08_005052, partial [Elysia chlorotica]